MNCQEALSLLYDIIDKESSEIDTKEVKDHLDKCKHCFEIYRMEKSIQNFIDEKLANDQSPERLDSLKNKILQNLDEIDTSCSEKQSKSFFKIPVVVLAAAASIVILIGAAYIANNLNSHNNCYVPFEKAHLVAVSDKSFNENPDISTLINDAYQNYGYQIDNAVDDFVLASGHYEEIMNTNMIHFIYKDKNRMVSVFLASEDEFGIPKELLGKGIIHNDIELFDHDCKECRLVYQKQGSTIIVTATSDKTVDLFEFIPGRLSY